MLLFVHQGEDKDWEQQLHEPLKEEGSQEAAEVQLQPRLHLWHVPNPFQLHPGSPALYMATLGYKNRHLMRGATWSRTVKRKNGKIQCECSADIFQKAVYALQCNQVLQHVHTHFVMSTIAVINTSALLGKFRRPLHYYAAPETGKELLWQTADLQKGEEGICG